MAGGWWWIQTWKQLYVAFASFGHLRWAACTAQGTASSLRSLKSDNQEYATDGQARFLVRSGGHYWFSVLQTRLEAIYLSAEDEEEPASPAAAAGEPPALEFLHARRTIAMGKWAKIRATGTGPCPRRHHSMTCLPDADWPYAEIAPTTDDHESGTVSVRRILVFGGQSEGIPFNAFNDLHLLVIHDPKEAEYVSSIAAGRTC